MKYTIPEVGEIEIINIILDLNGTLSVRGIIPQGAKERLQKLTSLGFNIVLFTGDQRGTAQNLYAELGISFVKCKNSQEKAEAMKSFKKENTAAIGNGRIDIRTFENSFFSIGTLQAEGIHAEILKYVDVLVPSINDALDLFLDADSLAATMRR